MNMKLLFLLSFINGVYANLNPEVVHKKTNIPLSEVHEALDYLDYQERGCDETWQVYYHIMPRLINEYKLRVGCEIGIFMGSHCKRILETTAIEKLYGIDPYMNYAEDNTGLVLSRNYWEIFHLKVKDKLAPFNDRFELLRLKSLDAAKLFKDESLDFIFLDASHTYDAVKEDLHAWYSKVRKGGLLVGDDYATRWPGVPQAVNEFFREKNLRVFIDNEQPRIWMVFKP